MSFNFDDDDFPFDMNELAKLFQNLQKQLFKQLQDQGIDPSQINFQNLDLSSLNGFNLDDFQNMMNDNPDVKRFGFSINMGPDGKPQIQPLNNMEIPFGKIPTTQQQKSGFEEPFYDIFYSEGQQQYQIVAEVQGIEDPEMIILQSRDEGLYLHAETGPFKYRVTIPLDHAIDQDSIKYDLNNGVLEITALSS